MNFKNILNSLNSAWANIDNINNTINSELYDTGWVDLELVEGYKIYSDERVTTQQYPQYRVINNVLYLRGLVQASTDNSSSTRLFTTIPSQYIPDIINNLYFCQRLFTSAAGDGSDTTIQLRKDGGLLAPNSMKTNDLFPLDGISFPIKPYIPLISMNKIADNSYIRLGLTSQYTVTQDRTEFTMPFDVIRYQSGNITYDNDTNEVIIGAGITSVLINVQLYYYSNITLTAPKLIIIRKNENELGCTSNRVALTMNQTTMSSSVAIPVSEGDKIKVGVIANNNDVIDDNSVYTFFDVMQINTTSRALYLNNGISAIHANLSTNTDLISNENQISKVPFDNVLFQCGNSLRLNDGCIEVLKDNMNLKVMTQVELDRSSESAEKTYGLIIEKNTYALNYQNLSILPVKSYAAITCNTMITANKGDKIYVDLRTVASTGVTSKVQSGRCHTYIEVQEMSNVLSDTGASPVYVGPNEPNPKTPIWLKFGDNQLDLIKAIEMGGYNSAQILSYDNNQVTFKGTPNTFQYIDIRLFLEKGEYTIYRDWELIDGSGSNYTGIIAINDITDNIIDIGYLAKANKSTTFTVDKDSYIRLYLYLSADTALPDISTVKFSNLYITKGTDTVNPTEYISPEIYIKNDNDEYIPFEQKQYNVIESGVEHESGRIIDGKIEYIKRINCGAGPNNEIKSIPHGLTNVTYTKIEGIAQDGESVFPINNTRPVSGTDNAAIGVYLSSGGLIAIATKSDRSNFSVYVDLYYTKN